MRKIPPPTYPQTAEEIYSRIDDLQARADATSPGGAKQSILREIAQLRAHADMKRWVSRPPKWAEK